jgi:hypothetical protein
VRTFADEANGDPVKVAQAVLTVVGLDEPPLRLLLGSDAYAYSRAAWARRLEEDEKGQHLSVSTDHDAAPDAGRRLDNRYGGLVVATLSD